MSLARIPLLVPDMPSADELLPYLRRIDGTRWYSNFGPLTRELESALGSIFTKHNARPVTLTTVSTATAGLELTLIALDLPPGARVLVPALTFVASATAIVRAGHLPVIADVDAHSWLLTPAIAREAARSVELAAVMPVATFGCPHDMAGWDAFTADTGIPVVIDAAGAFGNQWECGTATLVFSLHATKSLASGEGGLVVSRDAALVARVRQLSNFGINLDPRAATPVGQVDLSGTNAKMSEYHAAIGLCNLANWPALARSRVALFERYSTMLEGIAGLNPLWQATPRALTRTLLCFRVAATGLREAIELACANANIDTRRWYLPTLDRHDGFTGLPVCGALKMADALGKELVGLPFHNHMTETQLQTVIDAVRRAVGPPH